MLHFDHNNKPHPILIDYGLSSTLESFRGELYAIYISHVDVLNTHNAPELYLEQLPHPTSDLCNVARMVIEIGNYLNYPVVAQGHFANIYT